MSAAVGAALKKFAVYIFTDKKALKTVIGIVLGIIIIVVMPIVAVVSLFNGNIAIDTDRLQTMVVQNLSAEEKSKLQFVEDTMNSIDEKMKAAGFDGRVKEAQVLYVLALSDFSHNPDFADKLVSCFQENQTDEQLITAVNSAFGTQLTSEDFGKVMSNIRSLYIDTSEQDLIRAEDLLRKSSAQGNKYAKYTLGKALLDGELFLQNIPEAVKLITESADNGFALAQYLLGKLLYKGEAIPQDLKKAIEYLEKAVEQKNPYAAYLAGKIRFTEDSVKDIRKAIRNFEIAAENGNHYAEYMLGKIYLYGKEVERDHDRAIAYLTASAEHGNQYANQLLHSIKSNRNWFATLGSLRLLAQISRIIQNRLDDERRGKQILIDRKLKRKIDEKKQAHGLKQR